MHSHYTQSCVTFTNKNNILLSFAISVDCWKLVGRWFDVRGERSNGGIVAYTFASCVNIIFQYNGPLLSTLDCQLLQVCWLSTVSKYIILQTVHLRYKLTPMFLHLFRRFRKHTAYSWSIFEFIKICWWTRIFSGDYNNFSVCAEGEGKTLISRAATQRCWHQTDQDHLQSTDSPFSLFPNSDSSIIIQHIDFFCLKCP